MFGFSKRRRRRKVRTSPFPDPWRTFLLESFPIYARLHEADRAELEGHILVFLAEKRFEGCGGFAITDEVRVLIAAQACLLLLHRDTDYYPNLRSILVYPEAYVAKTRWREEEEDTAAHERARVGESWQTGAVVLAWSSCLAGAVDVEDGQNVVFHEFAHQLDQEDGAADGTPPLEASGFRERRGRFRTWARVMSGEYEQLRRASASGQASVLDRYGATNPAEFFAVATECFFEQPRKMKVRHPLLYEELQRFYQQDPAGFECEGPADSDLQSRTS